jgi:Ca2+-binding EF-hand superfamily protein
MKQSLITSLVAVIGLFFATDRVFAQDRADHAKFFKRLDTNSDGTLTKAEIGTERARFFERLVRIGDKNDDGQLTTGEFTAALSRVPGSNAEPANDRPQGRPQFDPRRMFARLDRNQDGKLTVKEVPEQARPLVQGWLRRAGKKEGEAITREELAKLMTGRPGFGRPPFGGAAFVKGLIKRLDRDGDGKLSKAEAPERMRENFSRIDRNNDGQIDERELGAVARRQSGQAGAKSKRRQAPKKK